MIKLIHVCGCSAVRPCPTGAKLFDRGLSIRLINHLERTIQVNRPYDQADVTPHPSFATLGEVARVR